MMVPCRGCQDRRQNCHAECDAYKAYHDERAEISRLRHEDGEFIYQQICAVEKTKRHGLPSLANRK